MVTLIFSHLNILSLHLFSCLCCHLFPALMFSLHEPSPHQDHFRVFCSKLMFCYIHISQGSLELHCLMWQPLSTWRFYIEIMKIKQSSKCSPSIAPTTVQVLNGHVQLWLSFPSSCRQLPHHRNLLDNASPMLIWTPTSQKPVKIQLLTQKVWGEI